MLFVTPLFPPTASGIGDYTEKLAAALTQRGHHVSVLTSYVGHPIRNENKSLLIFRSVRTWGLRGFAKLAQAPRRLEMDLINLQYVPHAYGRGGINLAFPFVVLWWRVILRRRIILTCHELHVAWRLHPSYLLQAMVHRLQLRILVAAANRVIVMTEGQRQQLQASMVKWIRRPLDVVPVGTTILPHPRAPSRQALLRNQLGRDDERLIGAFSLARCPQLETMEETVVQALRQEGQRVRLISLGAGISLGREGPAFPWKQTFGYLPEATLSGYLASLDVLLSLRSEGPTTRNTSIISALAHGVPVVAVEGRQPGQHSFWIDSGVTTVAHTPAAIVRAVGALLENDRERQRLSRQARAFYRQHFSWERIARAVEFLCKENA